MARHICHQGPPNGISNIISSLLFQPLRPSLCLTVHQCTLPTSCSHRHGTPLASIINYAVPVTVAGKAFAPRLARCNGGQWTRQWGCACGLCGLPHFFMQAVAPDRAAHCAAYCCCLGHQSTRCAPVDLLQTRDLSQRPVSTARRRPTRPGPPPTYGVPLSLIFCCARVSRCQHVRSTNDHLLIYKNKHLSSTYPRRASTRVGMRGGRAMARKRLPGAGRSQCS